jgi:hypothetical protein
VSEHARIVVFDPPSHKSACSRRGRR